LALFALSIPGIAALLIHADPSTPQEIRFVSSIAVDVRVV
jgi:hypothetical protein